MKATKNQPKKPAATVEFTPLKAKRPQVEYDRRGVKLPARARVGGIITPQ
jgi:hypothetical protein